MRQTDIFTDEVNNQFSSLESNNKLKTDYEQKHASPVMLIWGSVTIPIH